MQVIERITAISVGSVIALLDALEQTGASLLQVLLLIMGRSSMGKPARVQSLRAHSRTSSAC